MKAKLMPKKRKKKKEKSSINIFLLLGLGLLISYFFLNLKMFNFAFPKILQKELIVPKTLVNVSLTPLPTPTITPIPTPTPIPLVGYCLNVPVLMYHHVQPQAQAVEKRQTAFSVDNDEFDRQMEYLVSHGYTTITAKALTEALRNKTQLPPKSILITLDDGYRDNYDYAFPIFKKHNITANLLISTGLLEGSDYMSWSQLKEMKEGGLIYVIDHTWSHYSVNYGSIDKIKYEINTAKQQLQDSLGQTVDIFGYPYGGFNDLSISVLLEEGFVGAFSTISGWWQCDSFIMALHRTRIGNSPLLYYGL